MSNSARRRSRSIARPRRALPSLAGVLPRGLVRPPEAFVPEGPSGPIHPRDNHDDPAAPGASGSGHAAVTDGKDGTATEGTLDFDVGSQELTSNEWGRLLGSSVRMRQQFRWATLRGCRSLAGLLPRCRPPSLHLDRQGSLFSTMAGIPWLVRKRSPSGLRRLRLPVFSITL